MNRYEVNGKWYTINELSEMCGLLPHTLRDRLRRGYPIEEAVKPTPIPLSVQEFCEASRWEDWIGLRTDEVYAIYWRWCLKNQVSPCSKYQFSKQILQMYPMLHIVPMDGKRYFREKFNGTPWFI